MVVKRKKEYSKPEFTVFELQMEQTLLTMSSNSVDLTGAGVNEIDGDDNGIIIW